MLRACRDIESGLAPAPPHPPSPPPPRGRFSRERLRARGLLCLVQGLDWAGGAEARVAAKALESHFLCVGGGRDGGVDREGGAASERLRRSWCVVPPSWH